MHFFLLVQVILRCNYCKYRAMARFDFDCPVAKGNVIKTLADVES